MTSLEWIDGWMNYMRHEADGGTGGGDADAGDKGDADKGDADKGDADKADAGSLIGGKVDDKVDADADKAGDDDGDKPGDGDKSKDKKVAGAPETYAEFQIPDNIQVDKDRLDAAIPVFKEQGFTQEQAQAIVSLQVKEVERQNAAWAATQKEWLNELKSDSALGGQAFPESIALVRGFLARTAGADLPAIQALMDSTGYGSNPALFRWFHKLALVISEDAMPGPGSTKTPTTPEEIEAAKHHKRFPKMAAALSSGAT